MAKTTKKQGRNQRRASGWLSRTSMSRMFDLTPNGFDKSVRPLAPDACVRGEGKDLRFYARGVVEAWAAHHAKPVVGPGEADPLLSGGSSPALEDYRRQKAELAKLDLAERRRELVRFEEFRDLLTRIVRNLRGAGEQLQRQCGHEAWQILDEALVACEAAMRNHFEAMEAERGSE